MQNLNLSTGGESSPYIKYNAKAGRWFVKNHEGTDVEVPNPRFAIELENFKTGWISFPPASAPSFIWDVQGVRAPRPEGDYKEGFEVWVMGTDPQPGLGGAPIGVRQWTATAYAAKAGVTALNCLYEQQKGDNPGKMPIVRMVSVNVIKGDYGDNYEPVFQIEGWVERSKVPKLIEAAAPAPIISPPSPTVSVDAPLPTSSPLQQAVDKLGETSTNSEHTPPVTPAFQTGQTEQTGQEQTPSEELDDVIPF